MSKNYNIDRSKLKLPEYGRHIHQMVQYIKTINDRDLRNTQARAVIEVMGNLNPTLRDTEDFKHKIWDHLFIIADFDLDVDSPYPMPTNESLTKKPQKLNYPGSRIHRKYYGKNIEKILKELTNSPDKEAVFDMATQLAKYMRSKAHEYNHEHPSNESIMSDIKELSGNLISIDEEVFTSTKSDYKPATARQKHTQRSAKGSKNGAKSSNGKNNGFQKLVIRRKQQPGKK